MAKTKKSSSNNNHRDPPPQRQKQKDASKQEQQPLQRRHLDTNIHHNPIDFLVDLPHHCTYGRRIAAVLGKSSRWYNPQLLRTQTKPDPDGTHEEAEEEKETHRPSLAKAWAFFEHVTLERYVDVSSRGSDDHHSQYHHNEISAAASRESLEAHQQEAEEKDKKGKRKSTPHHHNLVHKFHKGDRKLTVAEPGERDLPTRLYSPLTTPLRQMGDFGLGYGIYFSTLRAFAILSLVVGLVNIPNLLYFRGPDYSAGQSTLTNPLLKGSAICTNQRWVPCPTCNDTDAFGSFGAYFKVRNFGLGQFYNINSNDAGSENTAAEWLNISSYLDWSNVDSNMALDWELQSTFDRVIPDDLNSRLLADFNITMTSTTLDVSGYKREECRGECLYDWAYCQPLQTGPECYLNVGQNTPLADARFEFMGFALKNDCEGATLRQGYISFGSLILMILGILVVRMKQNRLVVAFDEDEQTAQDYSIVILNPPADAHDPTEWKQFFENAFDCTVTVCTVDVDNDDLIQKLVRRRELRRQLEFKLSPGDIDNPQKVLKLAKESRAKSGICSCLSDGVHDLFSKIKSTEFKIKEHIRDHPKGVSTTNVFITFETETDQRNVLSKMAVGSLISSLNLTTTISGKCRFRGTQVLYVKEPDEPSTVRWQELNVTAGRAGLSVFLTSFVTLIILALACSILMVLYTWDPFIASGATAIMTFIFPMFAKALMNREYHSSESSRQAWLFARIAIFNIMITSLLLSIITPFTGTLDQREGTLPGLIPAVHAQFFSQLLLSPILQLLDISGNFSRHFLAPRAKTQAQMNMAMMGSRVYLAERYANLMKFMFLMIWYAPIYPAAFFMGFLALIICYFTDRFSLMRSWARSPQLGTQVSDVARNYFTPIAMILMAMFSGYLWSGMPFDSLCVDNDTVIDSSLYAGQWDLTLFDGNTIDVFGQTLYESPSSQASFEIEESPQLYKHCLQDMRAYIDTAFPPLPRWQPEGEEWMTKDQETVVTLFGWSLLVLMGAIALRFLLRLIRAIYRIFFRTHVPVGRDMGIPYSDVPAIDAYIPQAQSDLFSYPLFLCNIDNVDPHLFYWQDPENSHSYYDLTKDLEEILQGEEDPTIPPDSLSRVQYWPVHDYTC